MQPAAQGVATCIATIRLEAIGDNHVAANLPFDRVLRALTRLPNRERFQAVSQRRPWVAEVNGVSDRYGLARVFLKGLRDYREANKQGSRGVYLTFVLYPGKLYEVHELLSWHTQRRYFCEVRDAQVVDVAVEDVARRIAAHVQKVRSIISQAQERT